MVANGLVNLEGTRWFFFYHDWQIGARVTWREIIWWAYKNCYSLKSCLNPRQMPPKDAPCVGCGKLTEGWPRWLRPWPSASLLPWPSLCSLKQPVCQVGLGTGTEVTPGNRSINFCRHVWSSYCCWVPNFLNQKPALSPYLALFPGAPANQVGYLGPPHQGRGRNLPFLPRKFLLALLFAVEWLP